MKIQNYLRTLYRAVLSNLVAIRHMWRQTTVKIWFSNDKYMTYFTNYDKSGERKAYVVTIVANVATERIWLDTTDIECSKKKF
jgi:hypothetical protein